MTGADDDYPASPPPGEDLVLLVAPWATRTPAEDEDRRRVARDLARDGLLPVFAPLLLDGLLSDAVPEQRRAALERSAALARTVAASGGACVVVGERRTEGMLLDLAAWRSVAGAPEPVVVAGRGRGFP